MRLTCVTILHHLHAAAVAHASRRDRGRVERVAASLVLLRITIVAVYFAIWKLRMGLKFGWQQLNCERLNCEIIAIENNKLKTNKITNKIIIQNYSAKTYISTLPRLG